MIVFLDRSRRSDRHLEWKVRLFSVAAVLALVGMYFDERWMTLSALAVLLVGVLLRFGPKGPPAEREGEADGAEGSGDR